MKTKITKQKNQLLRIARLIAFVLLIGAGIKANAQCVAGFTYYMANPANSGVVGFTNTSTGTAITTAYFWNFHDGSSSAQMNPTHTFSSGAHYVCLTITDTSAGGCTSTFCDSLLVINNTTPSCTAMFTSYVDTTGVVYFNDMSTGTGLTYSWNFGDNTVGTNAGSTYHQYNAFGIYYVCLTVSNSVLGCSNSYCDSIVVSNHVSGACMGVVNTNFTSQVSQYTATFNNTPSGSNQVYYWDFGDNSHSSTMGTTSHTYSQDGTYQVCLTIYETGPGTDSCQQCQYVTINNSTPCSANFIIIQDSMNLYNYWVYNYATTNSSTTYLWNFGDSTTSTLQYPQHTYSGSGPYYLCLTVTQAGGGMISCTATYCDSIVPGHAPSQLTTLTVLNPLATGINKPVSTAENLENYPNPFSNSTIINYTINKNTPVELSILDLVGNKVAVIESGTKAEGNHKIIFDASYLSAGIYMLQLKTDTKVTTKKLVIAK